MKLPALHLTTAQVIAAVERLDSTHLPARTLSDWADAGIIVPSVRYERRRGRYNARIYNLSDLARVRVVVRLRRAGVSLAQVRGIVAYLDTELREVLRPKTRAALVFDGRRARVRVDSDDVLAELTQEAIEELDEDRALALEVEIERAARHARGGDEIADAGLVVAALREDAQRDVEELAAALVARGLGADDAAVALLLDLDASRCPRHPGQPFSRQ